MYHARREPQYRNYVEGASFSLCDGIGVVIGAWFQGKRVRRFHGPDLVLQACEYGVERAWRHFVYGGREGFADLMVEKLTCQFPGMTTAGTLCSIFREMTPEEEVEIIEEINNAKPDILWVCLGQPLQESWIARYIDRIDVPWLVGVGDALNFHAGTTHRAPKWMRRIGMEWFYRLCIQPRRFKRYVWSFGFLFEAIWEAVCQKAGFLGRRDSCRRK